MHTTREWTPRGTLALLVMLCVVGLLGGAVAALAASDSPSAQGGDVTFRVGWTTEPDNLNPFIGYESSAIEVFRLNYDLLVGVRASDLRPEPDLATGWSTSSDGKVWTFELRHGVTWHDGEPFTSRDVVFTYEYIMKNELANFVDYTENIESVRAVDDDTVEFTCSKPKANMLGMMVWIMPEHLWSEVDGEAAQTTYQNDPPIVGTGPFQVVEWVKGDYVKMKANPDYWRARPGVDEIVFTSYSNPDTMAQDLRSGAVQVAWGIPPAQFDQIDQAPDLRAIDGMVNGFTYLGFNCYEGKGSLGNPVLRDWRFRNALNYAVDKQRIAAAAYDGHAAPATTIIRADYYPASLDWHWQPPVAEIYGFDLEKTKLLLDEAGYRDTDGDGVRDHQGAPIELRLYVRTQAVAEQLVGKLLTGWLKKVGLKVDFQVLDEAAIFDRIYNFKGDTFAPDYDMFLWYWDSEPDPNFILSVLTGDQVAWGSDSQWVDAEYDGLYAQQQAALDPQLRKDIVWRMQEIVHEKSPYIPLTYPVWLEAYDSERWTGWVRAPAERGPVIYAIYNGDTYLFVHPKPVAGTGDRSPTGIIVGIATLAVVAIGIAALVVLRRRRRVEEL